jgi:hypothetical protein
MAIAVAQVRGFIVCALIFLAFWIKLRMEEQWMRSQSGEAYASYAHQTAALVPYLLASSEKSVGHRYAPMGVGSPARAAREPDVG